MIKFMVFFIVVLCGELSLGVTPIRDLKLTSDADGNGFAFTNASKFSTSGTLFGVNGSRNAAISLLNSTWITTGQTATALNIGIDGIVTHRGQGGSSIIGVHAEARAGATNNYPNNGNYNPIIVGGNFQGRMMAPFAGTNYGELVGVHAKVQHGAGAGRVGKMVAIQAGIPVFTTGGTVDGPVYGVRVANQGSTNWGTSYGLYIDSQSGSSLPYAIYIAGGNSFFGGNVQATTFTGDGNNLSNITSNSIEEETDAAYRDKSYVATLDAFGSGTILTVNDNILRIDVVTNTLNIKVTSTNGVGYSGPEFGAIFTNRTTNSYGWDWYGSNDFHIALQSLLPQSGTWFMIGNGDEDYWEGYGRLPVTLEGYQPGYGYIQIEWVMLTNTTYHNLNDLLKKDGSDVMTGDLNLGGNSVTNVENIWNLIATNGAIIGASSGTLSSVAVMTESGMVVTVQNATNYIFEVEVVSGEDGYNGPAVGFKWTNFVETSEGMGYRFEDLSSATYEKMRIVLYEPWDFSHYGEITCYVGDYAAPDAKWTRGDDGISLLAAGGGAIGTMNVSVMKIMTNTVVYAPTTMQVLIPGGGTNTIHFIGGIE
jgi:hypothetical protein